MSREIVTVFGCEGEPEGELEPEGDDAQVLVFEYPVLLMSI